VADQFSDHEVVDNEGSTVVETGTATTTPANVPSAADKIISGFAVDNLGSESLSVSMDGGTTFKAVKKKEFFSWNVKGNITQLVVKTLSGSTAYEIVINHEVT